jgi:hypothetical protein
VAYGKTKPTIAKGAASPSSSHSSSPYPRTITFGGPKSKSRITKKLGKKSGRL